MSRALVLGGGGGTGAAWATGLVAGLARHGLDLSDADLVLGTSAGAVVGARLTSGLPVGDLAELERPAPDRTPASTAMTRGAVLRWRLAEWLPGSARRKRARVGRFALRATTQPEPDRLDHIGAQLPTADWPATDRLTLVAVDARSGEQVLFTKASGVPLRQAVAASCAVPMLTPPIHVGGRPHLDGGVCSPANVDLAAGHDRVVVIAPLTDAVRPDARPDAQLAALGAPKSVLITMGPAARAALGDPSRRRDGGLRPAMAEAGRAEAADVLGRIRDVWAT